MIIINIINTFAKFGIIMVLKEKKKIKNYSHNINSML